MKTGGDPEFSFLISLVNFHIRVDFTNKGTCSHVTNSSCKINREALNALASWSPKPGSNVKLQQRNTSAETVTQSRHSAHRKLFTCSTRSQALIIAAPSKRLARAPLV